MTMLLVGCGGRPAPRPVTTDVPTPLVNSAPPPVRLIRLTHAPTWPLAGPPSLEPHYVVTRPWWTSCERRGPLSDDALVYVELWCRYRQDSSFDLAGSLARLRTTALPNLETAIRTDLANLLADTRDARAALAWIEKTGYDVELAELLAALYLDLGRVDDAAVVAADLQTADRLHRMSACDHDLLQQMFHFDPDHSGTLEDFPKIHGPSACATYAKRLACIVRHAEQVAGNPCAEACPGVTLDDDELGAARVLGARMQWTETSNVTQLLHIADLAASALYVYDAEELGLAALEAVLHRECDAQTVAAVQTAASRIQTSNDAQDRFAARRKRLIEMTVARCGNT